MTPLLLSLIVIYIGANVASQVWLKHAMTDDPARAMAPVKRKIFFTVAVVAMALSMFIKLGLLQDHELSYLFPFEAMQVIIIVLCAWLFLKEKLTLRLIFGLVMISIGIFLVARTS